MVHNIDHNIYRTIFIKSKLKTKTSRTKKHNKIMSRLHKLNITY